MVINDVGQGAGYLNSGHTLEDCLLIEEVQELTDDAWWKLVGYGTDTEKYKTLSQDYNNADRAGDAYRVFVNANWSGSSRCMQTRRRSWCLGEAAGK